MALDPNIPITFEDVQICYDRALLLEDRDYVRLVLATVLANQLTGNPVWLMIVGPSSSGKTAMLSTLKELAFEPGKEMMCFVSDLTENTLASGFKSSGGETSLIMKMPIGGMFVFKDFTSMLVKRSESRDAVMGQLREVYDRNYVKRTGNDNDTVWEGKIGAIAGVTEAVHEYMATMSVMGDRFIMYAPAMPDRMKLLRFMMDLEKRKEDQDAKLKEAGEYAQAYLKRCYKMLDKADLVLSEEAERHLMEVADFVTRARSGVMEDPRNGRVRFVPSPEMPTRLISQLLSIARVLCLMRIVDGKDPTLQSADLLMLYKIAFDSIPLKRLWALRELATYSLGVSTSGIAAKLDYQTEVVQEWLTHLNALHIIRRDKNSGRGELWRLTDEARALMVTYQKVEVKNEMLDDTDRSEDEQIIDQTMRQNNFSDSWN